MLRGTGQQILKALHLSCVALNLGGTAALFAILGLAARRPALAPLLPELFDWVVAPAYYGLLLTGAIYSLHTNWGFARYYWIACKWALVSLLFVATVVVVAPALVGTGAYADGRPELFALFAARSQIGTAASVTVLLVIIFIATLKPWGRVQRDWRFGRRWQLLLAYGTMGVALLSGIVNHRMLEDRRRLPIGRVSFASMPDGIHVGRAVFEFAYEVQLTTRAGRVVDARMLANRDSDYARFAEQVLPRVVRAQSLQVDAVSGATTTSVAILKAAEDAVRAAARERNSHPLRSGERSADGIQQVPRFLFVGKESLSPRALGVPGEPAGSRRVRSAAQSARAAAFMKHESIRHLPENLRGTFSG